MNVPKKALITGITGQDGSYLAELLLEKGYEVFGIIRRASTFNTSRINHLFKDPHEKDVKLHLIHGDLDDSSTINRIIREIMPDEIYNLGAQSHVRVSFDIPEYTGNVTGLGALRILETIHRIEQENRKRIKYYQASSSEMFGKVQETPQNEKTPFYPRSPYGVAKVYSYWTTKNYREAYNIFACNGILFNHECISENTPLIVRNKSTQIISIKRIKDIRRAREKGRNIQQWILDNIGIWDGEQFVDLKLITATRRKRDDNNFHCKIINTRHGVIETTNHHNLIDYNNQKIRAREVDIGQKLLHKTFPAGEEISRLSEEEALFLGMMVGDGYISEDGEKGQFSNMDEKIIKVMGDLWRKIALGSIITKEYKTEYGKTKQTSLKGNSGYLKLARKEIYTYDKFKKVPDRILNGSKNIKLAFLMGYNITDGLKSNPTIYEFKNFKTNSIVLAQGLLFLIKNTTNQGFNITFEEDKKNYGYYSVNFLSPTDNSLKEETVAQLLDEGHGQRQICMETGISRIFIRKIQNGEHAQVLHHLSKQKEEVKKVLYHLQQPGWVYDIETGSGKFMGGLGNIVVANSPRRGETFVTKKITRAVIRIKEGVQDILYLGNLDAKRDWGHARDYVEAIWLMMQQEKPEDYVISTGETHSVREFLELAFKEAGIEVESNGKKGLEEEYIRKDNGKIVVKIDPKYFRPTEVDILLGDSSKAQQKLGWRPKIKFKELVKEMIEYDMRELQLELYGTRGNYK